MEFSNIQTFSGSTLEHLGEFSNIETFSGATATTAEFSNIETFSGSTLLSFGILSATTYVPGSTVTLTVTGVDSAYTVEVEGAEVATTDSLDGNGDGTISFTAVRAVAYGADATISLIMGGSTFNFDVPQVAESGLDYVTLGTLADAEFRITAVPDLQTGYQVAWYAVANGDETNVTIAADGTFEVDAQVYTFTVVAFDGTSWGTPAEQDVRAQLETAGITFGAVVPGTPVITQAHELAAGNAVGGTPTLQTPTLSQEAIATPVSVVTGAPVLGKPAFEEIHLLGGAGIAAEAPILGEPTIAQDHLLTGGNLATGAVEFGPAWLAQSPGMAAESLVTPAPVLGQPALEQNQGMVAGDLTAGEPVLGTPALRQLNRLESRSIVGTAPVLGTPVFTQRHFLDPDDIATGAVVLGNPGEDQSGRYLTLRRIMVEPAMTAVISVRPNV